MSQGIEGDSSSTEASQDAVGVTKQTADDYTPGENETAEETAKNILALLQEGEDGDGEENNQAQESEESSSDVEQVAASQGNEAQQETPAQAAARARDENGRFIKGGQQKPAEQQKPQGVHPDLLPPTVLSADEQKLFANLPEGLKRGVNRVLKNQQAQWTTKNQEATRHIERSKQIVDGATLYIQANNIADEQGRQYTPERLFNELIQKHNEIVSDPDRAIAGLIQSNPNAKVENINAYLKGENPSGINLSSDPTIRALQNQVSSLLTKLSGFEQQQNDARIQPAAEEFHAVMHEVDQNGEYVRPELHNDDFLESTKPIVSALLRTNPGMSRGEAMKKAHATLTGKAYSQNGNQTILPARQNNLERARSAAVSVRGAIPPTGAQPNLSIDQMEGKDIPDSIEETVRMAMRQLSNGG